MDVQQSDYVIVGAGSAGCVLANRLSESGQDRVTLLEAGQASHPLSTVPMSFAFLIDDPAANWRYRSTPEEITHNREIPIPRGKLLGGSSAINGLVYVRGQQQDYNTWAQVGNPGWSWDDVEPVFRRIENYEHAGDGAVRGNAGPLKISDSYDQNPLYEAMFAAGRECGLPDNPDYNGPKQEGVVRTQTTIHNGRRMSTAVTYLKPARTRRNLRVETNAQASRLLFDGKRCIGVEVRQHGQVRRFMAAKEVILSGGSIGSPQLLELSGIGQAEILKAAGIDPIHELRGVGAHLRDHINTRMQWRLKQRGLSFNDRMGTLGRIGAAIQYAITRRGFLTLPSAPILAFLKSSPDLDQPDLQMHLLPYTIKDLKRRKFADYPGIMLTCYQLRPESLGDVHITSPDPDDHPRIRFNFLSDAIDRAAMVSGVHWMRRLMGSAAMAPYNQEEIQPGFSTTSDEAILNWIAEHAQTAYHPIGTCRMGPDAARGDVVDCKLKVHGLDGVRIADASIMPTMVSGNTNAGAIMIGEKAGDLILSGH